MFKHYIYQDNDNMQEFYVGKTSDIKALYKAIRRNKSTNLYPLFCDTPKFSESKLIYALCIDEDGGISIANSDTMMYLICMGEVVEA